MMGIKEGGERVTNVTRIITYWKDDSTVLYVFEYQHYYKYIIIIKKSFGCQLPMKQSYFPVINTLYPFKSHILDPIFFKNVKGGKSYKCP